MSTLRISLPQTAASPARARRQLSRFAADNELSDRASVALLVLSELVTNAVLHGTDPIDVLVSSEGDLMRIEVSDGGSGPGDFGPGANRGPDDLGGRGLQIVDSLARRWGIVRRDDGKTVWAEVGLDA